MVKAIRFIGKVQTFLKRARQDIDPKIERQFPQAKQAQQVLEEISTDLHDIQRMLSVKTLMSLAQVEDEASIAEAI